jgi:hypothetical protein
MELQDYVGVLIGPALFQIPILIVSTVAVVLALVRHKRHPRVSTFAIVGFGGYGLTSACFGTLLPLISVSLVRGGESATMVGATLAGVNAVSLLLSIVWWSCIIAAVFGWRSSHASEPNLTGL